MIRWLYLTIISTIVTISKCQNCTKSQSMYRGEQLTCTNISSANLQNLTLQRTHWLACENCDIETIDQNTFNYKRNNISYLILSKNNIRTLKNFAFAKFAILKVLNLRDNVLENIKEKSFFGIKQLWQLDLSNNLISKLTDNLFAELEHLNLLNLDHNEIYHVQTNAFMGLSNLKYLYLNYNNLEDLSANMFKHLTSLKIMYVQNNRLVTIHPMAFTNLVNLNYLYLTNNSVSYLLQYNFKPLVNLIDLQIRGNALEEIQTSSFNGLRNLKSLHLGQNNIRKVHPYGFVGLDSLEILDLISNEFEYISLDYFKDMPELAILWLENNLITTLDIPYKSEYKNSLNTLSIRSNNLTFLNYKLLHHKLANLKELRINENPWKCEFLYNMYNYFSNKSVLVCVSDKCKMEDTENYIEKLCAKKFEEKFNVTDNLDLDFSTDAGHLVQINLFVSVALIFIQNLFSC